MKARSPFEGRHVTNVELATVRLSITVSRVVLKVERHWERDLFGGGGARFLVFAGRPPRLSPPIRQDLIVRYSIRRMGSAVGTVYCPVNLLGGNEGSLS